jgi:TonB family protein
VSEQGLRLQVGISFDLGPSGYLSNVSVLRSSGYPEVDNAVVTALRSWRFSVSPGAGNVRGEVTYRIIPR